jgi:WD40 repeat protein
MRATTTQPLSHQAIVAAADTPAQKGTRNNATQVFDCVDLFSEIVQRTDSHTLLSCAGLNRNGAEALRSGRTQLLRSCVLQAFPQLQPAEVQGAQQLRQWTALHNRLVINMHRGDCKVVALSAGPHDRAIDHWVWSSDSAHLAGIVQTAKNVSCVKVWQNWRGPQRSMRKQNAAQDLHMCGSPRLIRFTPSNNLDILWEAKPFAELVDFSSELAVKRVLAVFGHPYYSPDGNLVCALTRRDLQIQRRGSAACDLTLRLPEAETFVPRVYFLKQGLGLITVIQKSDSTQEVQLRLATHNFAVSAVQSFQSTILDMSIACDSGHLAVATEADGLQVWDAVLRCRLHHIAPKKLLQPFRRVALSPDGRFLALGQNFGLRLLDLTSGNQASLGQMRHSLQSLQFSPNGFYLAISLTQGHLYVLDFDQAVRAAAPKIKNPPQLFQPLPL